MMMTRLKRLSFVGPDDASKAESRFRPLAVHVFDGIE
jgi:hypothetical protein